MSENFDNISVMVSGTAVFKAVKNYLKDSVQLRVRIDEIVDKVATDSYLTEIVRTKLNAAFTNWTGPKVNLKDKIVDLIRIEVRSALEPLLTEEVMNKLVTNMVFSFKTEK